LIFISNQISGAFDKFTYYENTIIKINLFMTQIRTARKRNAFDEGIKRSNLCKVRINTNATLAHCPLTELLSSHHQKQISSKMLANFQVLQLCPHRMVSANDGQIEYC